MAMECVLMLELRKLAGLGSLAFVKTFRVVCQNNHL